MVQESTKDLGVTLIRGGVCVQICTPLPKFFHFYYYHIRHVLWKFGVCSTSSTSNFIAFSRRWPSDALVRALQNGKISKCPLISSKIVISWWNLAKMFILMIETCSNYLFQNFDFSIFLYFPQKIQFWVNFGLKFQIGKPN